MHIKKTKDEVTKLKKKKKLNYTTLVFRAPSLHGYSITLLDSRYKPMRISKKMLQKLKCLQNCLIDMRIHLMHKYADLICHDIHFDCMPSSQKKPIWQKNEKCINMMRAGKCPYKIAKKLFPNAYKENQR